MAGQYPDCPFERYADDIVIHCWTLTEAQAVKAAVQERLRRCKLGANPQKTRIVYCQDSNRTDDHEHTQFAFLGYGFQPRVAKNRWGELFTAFLPALSRKAMKAIVTEVRGWGTCYGRFYPTAFRRVFRHLNRRLVRWAQRKYKRFRTHERRAWHYLRHLAQGQPDLFAHWAIGSTP